MTSVPNDPTLNEENARLVAEDSASGNSPALSVSELSNALKRTVEDRFGHVRVRGEISGWKRAASGHGYLCLKDDNAVLDGVMWKGVLQSLRFAPEDGLEVIATGKLTTYPGRSKYQIVIEKLEIAGAGALMALLEQRRRKLLAAGLFDPARKRPLPFLPELIGVVTSPTGAVIRDILHRLEDRFPRRVIVWPVLVQGETAAAQVAAAVRGFNAISGVGRPDLLIVARGGGSIEDLWAFNEEIVVRAVAESGIPTISAVGHETDTTLCDFAADVRAPTPTAAAEMAVPVRADLITAVRQLSLRAERCAQRVLESRRERVEGLGRRLPTPRALLGLARQRADDIGERLPRALAVRAQRASASLDAVGARLRPQLLDRRLKEAGSQLERLWRVAESLNPKGVLRRGYALVTDTSGHVVTSAAGARAARRVSLQFADGGVDATIGSDESAPRAPSPKKAAAASSSQPKLL